MFAAEKVQLMRLLCARFAKLINFCSLLLLAIARTPHTQTPDDQRPAIAAPGLLIILTYDFICLRVQLSSLSEPEIGSPSPGVTNNLIILNLVRVSQGHKLI